MSHLLCADLVNVSTTHLETSSLVKAIYHFTFLSHGEYDIIILPEIMGIRFLGYGNTNVNKITIFLMNQDISGKHGN